MQNSDDLILRVSHEEFQNIRQLIIAAKASLNPIEIHAFSAGKGTQTSVNSKYFDVISLDRRTHSSEILLRALPESLSSELVCIYLSYNELQTLVALLNEKAR